MEENRNPAYRKSAVRETDRGEKRQNDGKPERTEETVQEERGASMNALINGRLVMRDTVLDDMVILYDRRIERVVPRETWEKEQAAERCEVVDTGGAYVAPGFINLHIHGCMGADTMDGSREALETMSAFQASTGVTTFLPTTMTCGPEALAAAAGAVREAMRDGLPGARAAGLYLEGPFIAEAYKGAQKASHIAPADYKLVEPWEDVVRIVMIAPETVSREELRRFTGRCRDKGIGVTLGHTAADYDTAMYAIRECGAGQVTHLFNAMTGLHHRNPGVVGAALDSGAVCELIADNLHVHPAAQRIVCRVKGCGGIALVTDSMRACGLGDCDSELGGQEVFVRNGEARLADGTLAGSVLTLDRALANFRENTGVSLPEAVRTVTEAPARLLGTEKEMGALAPGYLADFTVFDEKGAVSLTIVEGHTVFSK